MNAMTPESIANAALLVLLALLLGAVWSDVRRYRIPNWLVFYGAAVGVFLNTVLPEGSGFTSALPGALGFWKALAGLAFGLAAMLPLYALRAMGAGDVKLMAMVGAFLGTHATTGAVLMVFATGGVLSLALAFKRRTLPALMTNVSTMAKTSAFKVMFFREMPVLEVSSVSAGKLPYGVAIAVGTVLYYVLVRYTELFNAF